MIATSQQAATAAQLLRHEGWTRRLARTLTSDDALADDVAQDTWVSALRRPPEIQAPLRPWLSKVVRHNLFNRSRLGRRREARERAAGLPPDPVSPEELVGRGEIHRLLVDTVMALKEPYRQVVVMRYFDGFTSAQIAMRMNVPPATVRGRLKTALDLLRGSLDARRGGRRDWLEDVRDLFDPTSGPPEVAAPTPSSPGAAAHSEAVKGNGSRPPAAPATRPSAPRVLPGRALPAKAVVLTIVLGAGAIPVARRIASWKHHEVPADPTTEEARADDGPQTPEGETQAEEGGRGTERIARPRAALDSRGRATPGAVSRTAERHAIAMAAPAGDGRVVPFAFKGIVGRARSSWQALAAKAPPGDFRADRDSGLANVVVKIVAGPGPAPGATPATNPAVLRLGPAGFAPHVSVARVGQDIAVENADDAPHLVEVLQDSTVLFKGSLPPVPAAQRVAVAAEGTVIRLTLSTRPQAVAFVVTAASSFHAITDAQGRFFLQGVPPGAYVVEAWHELSGVTRSPVEVSPAGRGEVEIVMDQAPSATRHGLCQIAGHRANPVSEACREGGITAAKKTMKRLIWESRRRGGAFTCEGCHVELASFRLREGADTKLVELLRLIDR
jgi:RNA polymerase sigma factor (sigma-70 family)